MTVAPDQLASGPAPFLELHHRARTRSPQWREAASGGTGRTEVLQVMPVRRTSVRLD
ncbi:hypothetical protein [Flavimaricola marinus]|uniref:hypothetical protein n=1 Tax=Flavimaricola marinus TaxID=1819565 RepID=UPI001455C193|nr:hypothetical protein [Flavimaricola marinus]